MTNSMNPNKGHYNPGPVIDRGPQRPAPAGQDDKSGSKSKGGRL